MKQPVPLPWLIPLLVTLAVACGGGAELSGDARVPLGDAGRTLILATTTTTYDTGLIAVLEPLFEEESGYRVVTVVGGSGQMIALASRGDADVLLAHSPDAEQAMVARRDGVERTLVMYNDFVVVGPAGDPAGIGSVDSPGAAFAAIAAAESGFISRGDESGTHVKELSLWQAADVDPAGQRWYDETGLGQSATLQIASQRRSYALADRGTFLAQRDTLDLKILFQRAAELRNIYHVIVINPRKHPDVNVDGARAFAAFLVRNDTQRVIGEFGIAEVGQSLFVPAAGKPDVEDAP